MSKTDVISRTLFDLAEPICVIFPREVLEEDGDLKKRMIGTGPYVLKEHTRKVRIVLARNPDYYDKGRPYVDEYVILSTPDAATRMAAFRTGQSDIIWLASPGEVETGLNALEGIKTVQLDLVFVPSYSMEMLSEEARLTLGLM